MSLVIRLARAGTKKRPVYHVVVADNRAPRDGRFVERLGYFNPLLPKEKTERLKLDLEKVQAWMKKGAQPSDRVMRFLDTAGIMKRPKRNNPEKAIPRKERKAKEGRGREGGGACAARGRCQPGGETGQGGQAGGSRARTGGELRLAAPRRDRAHLRCPYRCRPWRPRRGEAVVVYGRSGGRH